jgi:hypothetical protein
MHDVNDVPVQIPENKFTKNCELHLLKQQPIELNEYNDIKHYHQDKMLYQKNDYFYIKSFFWQIMKNHHLYNTSSS